MAQLVKHLTWVQVMISQLVSSSPVLGSVMTAQGLEPASDSVCVCVCVCVCVYVSASPLLALCLSLSLSKINKH